MGVHLLIIQMADDRWRMPNGIRDPACELHASALLFLQWTLFLFGKVCSESLPILEQYPFGTIMRIKFTTQASASAAAPAAAAAYGASAATMQSDREGWGCHGCTQHTWPRRAVHTSDV